MTLTMHVLPVGRSILTRAEGDAPELQSLRRVLSPTIFDPALNPDRKVRAELASLTDRQTRLLDLRQILTTPRQWDEVRSSDWQLCAEWTSLTVASHARSDDGCCHVLIASDTDDGLRSAVLVAGQYALGERIHYVDDPVDAANLEMEPGAVYVFRIPRLDFSVNAMTDLTWFALGTVGHTIQQTARRARAGQWEVLLHLTGGYKAMIPYLLVMAEGIKTACHIEVIEGRVPTVRAVSVHEQPPGTELGEQILIELPVRWVQDRALRDLIAIKEHVGGNAAVRTDKWIDWRGQWIESGGAKLTPSGMIITRVL